MRTIVTTITTTATTTTTTTTTTSHHHHHHYQHQRFFRSIFSCVTSIFPFLHCHHPPWRCCQGLAITRRRRGSTPLVNPEAAAPWRSFRASFKLTPPLPVTSPQEP
ncbi:hypothetical protein E2C01_036308 [Portunus trituberculatus]|uniref:Uncharacterized protein n=1 Tax=Portunus trituberculatus TaxID=210409 RepID=A0A5B7F6E9_PORTR|nr:hypothetical protein [Portunus trituberculatus]